MASKFAHVYQHPPIWNPGYSTISNWAYYADIRNHIRGVARIYRKRGLSIGLFRMAGLTRGSWGQKVKFHKLCCYGNGKKFQRKLMVPIITMQNLSFICHIVDFIKIFEICDLPKGQISQIMLLWQRKKIPKKANGPNNHHAKFELHLTYRWFYKNLWNLRSSHRFPGEKDRVNARLARALVGTTRLYANNYRFTSSHAKMRGYKRFKN